MTAPLRRAFQADDGGAVLELGLLLPVLMLMVMGVLQLGVVLFGYESASFAARSAARFASVHSSTSLAPATTASVQAAVTPWLWMGNQVGAPTVTPSWPGGNTVGGTVKVTVSVTWNVVLPFTTQKQVVLTAAAARTIVR